MVLIRKDASLFMLHYDAYGSLLKKKTRTRDILGLFEGKRDQFLS